MSLTCREWWALAHGLGFGGAFFLGFTGVLVDLHALTPDRVRRLQAGCVLMAAAVWGAVVTGTWVVYPWYRSLSLTSPSSILLSDPSTEQWHELGMEWKEHIAWLSPILATIVVFLVLRYGPQLGRDRRVRRLTMTMFELSVLFAVVPGVLGALITRAAPVR